jgi:hypothetical protein
MFGEELWQSIRKPLISIFIVTHIWIIISCMIPQNPLVELLHRPFNKYMNFMGLWQTYAVFAPPRANNLHLIALITYKDGTTRIEPLPRLDRMPLFDKVRKERFRKYLEDNTAWTELYGSFLVKDLARYVARQSNFFKGKPPTVPANPPHSVSLIRFHSDLPNLKPPALSILQSSNPLAQGPKNRPHTDMKLILHYYVNEDDLR